MFQPMNQAADDRCNHERQQYRWAGVLRRRCAGDHKNAGTDDRTDAQCGNTPWSQGAAKCRTVDAVVIAEIGLAGE
jgi:hypothetical protein